MTCQDDLMEFKREIERIKKEQRRKRASGSQMAEITDYRRSGKRVRVKY